MGPYYPVANKPRNAGTDLTRVPGATREARGRLLYLTGRLVNLAGDPIPGARIEIWQANADGRYSHPSDGNAAEIDPNFAGYGVAHTSANGGYRFRTVVPGGYPVTPGWERAPHIHFLITGRHDRHVTQMWFPDHPANPQDRLLTSVDCSLRGRLIARLEGASPEMEADACVARFNIVLPNG